MPQQIINLGATGSGAGGDSARTAFEKAIANFAELYPAALPGTAAQKQAARDMFGLGTAATKAVQTGPTDTTAGAVATTEGARYAALANYGAYYSGSAGKNVDALLGGESGLFASSNPGTFPPGFGSFIYIETQQTYTSSSAVQEAYDYGFSTAPEGRRAFRVRGNGGAYSPWRTYRHTGNTTVDGNGFIKTASPIVNLYADRVERNDAKEVEDVNLEKVAPGKYVLTGCPPLATSGWYIEQPKDRNNDVYHNLEWEYDGDKRELLIETFQRIWNPATGRYDNGEAVDIETGRFVTLRFEEDPSLHHDPEISPDPDTETDTGAAPAF